MLVNTYFTNHLELVALTPIKKNRMDMIINGTGPNPRDFFDLIALPPAPSPARFSNEALAPISRFSSLLVCSSVLLRISRSAVRFTLKETNSSYLRRRELVYACICSGSILYKLEPSGCGAGREWISSLNLPPSSLVALPFAPPGATSCGKFVLNHSRLHKEHVL